MKARLVVLLLCAGLTGGCVHTHEVGRDPSQTPPEEMLRSLTGEIVTVTLWDSRQLHGTLLAALVDTLQLLPGGADTSVCLPVSEIATICTEGGCWGPIAGLVAGGLAGGFIGGAIAKGASGSDGLGSVDENMGGLVGAVAGAAVGVSFGAYATAADNYRMPSGGIRITKPADTVTVEVGSILEETEFSVTIPWYDRTTSLPRSQISVVKEIGTIRIRAPRSLLYEGNRPRYIDRHK